MKPLSTTAQRSKKNRRKIESTGERSGTIGEAISDAALIPTVHRLLDQTVFPTESSRETKNHHGKATTKHFLRSYLPPLEKDPSSAQRASNPRSNEKKTKKLQNDAPIPSKKRSKSESSKDEAGNALKKVKGESLNAAKAKNVDGEEENDVQLAEEVLRRSSLFIQQLSPDKQSAFWNLRTVARGEAAQGNEEVGAKTKKKKGKVKKDNTDISRAAPRVWKEDSVEGEENSDSDTAASSEPSWIMESDDEEIFSKVDDGKNEEKANGKPRGGGLFASTNDVWSSEEDD